MRTMFGCRTDFSMSISFCISSSISSDISRGLTFFMA